MMKAETILMMGCFMKVSDVFHVGDMALVEPSTHAHQRLLI